MAESLLALAPVGVHVRIHGLRAVVHHNSKFGFVAQPENLNVVQDRRKEHENILFYPQDGVPGDKAHVFLAAGAMSPLDGWPTN